MTDDLNEEQMSPEASPGKVTKKSGVRRVNNLPVYLIGSVLAVFLLIMVLVASDRAAKQNLPAEASSAGVGNQNAGNSAAFAKELVGTSQQEGIIPAASAQPPHIPDLSGPTGAVLVARPDNLDLPPSPPNSANPGQLQPTQRNDELDRIRMAKMQQFEEAVKGKTGVQVGSPRSSGSSGGAGYGGAPGSREEAAARLAAVRQQIEAARYEDPTEAYKARLAEIQGSGMAGGGRGATATPQLVSTAAGAGGKNSLAQFAGSGQGDRWELGSKTEPPRTPFELRAGFVLPATLISGINSELPGQITAQIAQNVYDTPTGKYLLIPQGSRLVGSYSSDVQYGQARVLVAWQRIVFPDGKAMDIGSMPGADSAGYSGFKDKVNNHYVRIFGSALLMSAVTAGVSLSQDVGNNPNDDSQRASDALSEALGQQLGQVMAQMIAKNLNIAPTLEIRPGYRFNVMVTKDMTFSKPYKSFDY